MCKQARVTGGERFSGLGDSKTNPGTQSRAESDLSAEGASEGTPRTRGLGALPADLARAVPEGRGAGGRGPSPAGRPGDGMARSLPPVGSGDPRGRPRVSPDGAAPEQGTVPHRGAERHAAEPPARVGSAVTAGGGDSPKRVLPTPPPASPPPARSLGPRPGRGLAGPHGHSPHRSRPARCEAPSAPRRPPAPARAAAAHSLWPPPALPPSWPLASPAPGGPSRRVT